MAISDFPTWFGLGSYGGLACTIMSAAGITTYALMRRRGSSRQLARCVLVCLLTSVFMLGSIWWDQNRLELYGPSLADGEVFFWLCWTAILGWLIPVGVLFGYLLLAESQITAESKSHLHQAPSLAPLDDPARYREPLGPGIAWGQLIPLGSPTEPEGSSEGRPIVLTRQMTMLGREKDCDIVIEDQRTSRHHAEIDWDHGRAQLVDRTSMNGTLVNRQTVRGPVPLVAGDILDLGAQRYRFEFLPAAEFLPQHPLGRSQPEPEIETKKVSTIIALPVKEPASLTLTGLSANVAGATWVLDQPLATIGREKERQVYLPHESVSRLHAQIVRQEIGYFLSDLHSSNGTFLNGELLRAPSLLSPGDILRIGAIELQCDHIATEKSQQSTIPLDGASAVAQTV